MSEAAYMSGLERNADVVKLASYAPLLANEDYVQWRPDLIWFDNHASWVSADYQVQMVAFGVKDTRQLPCRRPRRTSTRLTPNTSRRDGRGFVVSATASPTRSRPTR